MERPDDPAARLDVPGAIAELLRRTWDVAPNELSRIVEAVRDVLGADTAPGGDTVLFYTDGAVESRPSGGEAFGLARLIDHLAVAVQEGTAPAETVRRLSTSIVAYNDSGLTDDATLLLLEYHGPGATVR